MPRAARPLRRPRTLHGFGAALRRDLVRALESRPRHSHEGSSRSGGRSAHGRPRGSRAIPRSTRELGDHGEALAEQRLAEEGFEIIARNVRTARGEIDRIALEAGTLCFIEVRLRTSLRYGSAAASVDARKQARIVSAARAWLATAELPPHSRVRFDVVTIDLRAERPTIELYRDAFDSGSGRR